MLKIQIKFKGLEMRNTFQNFVTDHVHSTGPLMPWTTFQKQHLHSSRGCGIIARLPSHLERIQFYGAEDGHMSIHASSSLLDGIDDAGTGKAGILPAVLSTMSHNKPYKGANNQIGNPNDPRKPVVLTRTKADATAVIKERAGRADNALAPIYRFVDMAKDLYGSIPWM